MSRTDHASPSIVVTGMGALTPLGLTVEDFWEGLLASQSGAAPITHFDASDFKTRFACEVSGFDPDDHFDHKQARRFDPYAQYALVAARQALSDADLTESTAEARDRTGVIFGTGIGGIQLFEEQIETYLEDGPRHMSPFFVPMMITNMAAGQIAREYGFYGPNHAVVSACATGNHAISDAVLLLRDGQADVVVCGGSEAGITPIGIGGFNAMRALSTRNDAPATASRPFDTERDGFVLGEGAGALVLETREHAEERGADAYVEVAGIGMSNDAHHYAAPDPDGRGARLAMQNALSDASLPPDAVQHVNVHATSTPSGDATEGGALKSVFGAHAPSINLSATKSMTGHLLGAAGAIEAIASVLAITRDVAPPTINTETSEIENLDFTLNGPKERSIDVALSNAFGFGGHNTSIAFQKLF